MKQDWHPDELAPHWTLSKSELELLGTKTGTTRLGFGILLKAFQFSGRFPGRREDVAGGIVAHLASQTGLPQEAYFEGEWSERTQRYQRALIREACGFRAFRAEDESSLIAWVSERVTSPDATPNRFGHRRCLDSARRRPLLLRLTGQLQHDPAFSSLAAAHRPVRGGQSRTARAQGP